MTASTLTLAELVSRGMLAINDSSATSSNIRSMPAKQVPAAIQRDAALLQKKSDSKSPEYKRIVESADRLVEKIRNVGTLNDDPLVMRRQILQSLQLFLTDISSKP